MMNLRRIFFLVALGAAAGLAAAETTSPLAQLFVERDGVYRVTDAALTAAGVRVPDADVARLRLRLRGQDVPLRLLGGAVPPGAGRFAFDFAGRFPRGTKTYEDPYNRANVYVLDVAPAGARLARYADAPAKKPGRSGQPATPLVGHYEENRKLMRFSGTQVPDETWYWELAMASDKEPKAVTVRVDRVDRTRPATLRVRLQGYSSLPKSPDHDCALAWNGTPLGRAVWDGQSAYTFEHEVPAGLMRDGNNTLTFHVDGANTDGLDVVLLDWIEVEYSQRLDISAAPQFGFNAGKDALDLTLSPFTRASIYDTATGRVQNVPAADARTLRYEPARAPKPAPAKNKNKKKSDGVADAPAFRVELPRFWAVREGAQYAPEAIQAARPTDLRTGPGADAVIVTHPEFLPVAERLAGARRAEGLTVRIASVEDVYGQFTHGFLDPAAIRDFLRFAWKNWKPQPRYVLLLGDASWDYKNRTVDDANYPDHEFIPQAWNVTVPKIVSTPLKPGDAANDRQRVPTYQWQSPWGHAASDNFFALLDDDPLPDVAVGRIPAGTLAEAEAAVDKILAYGRRGDNGVEAEGALFITDQYMSHQTQCDRLAESAGKRGFGITKIYPKPEDQDNEGNSASIRAAFDKGQSLVVFAGHGGRYIWRTGPPDPQKNHDLFTLEHLDQLQPTAELPVVISLTCYSAPFDHPTADSIGEKLLRLDGRGAVAVVASSWRNVPPFTLAQRMIDDLGNGNAPRLGDAFLEGMRAAGASDSLHTYNLLGDPSMPFQAPAAPAEEPHAAGSDAAAPAEPARQ